MKDEHDDPFDGESLKGVRDHRADMTGAEFDGVNLADARFFAVLSRARFVDTNLSEAVFDDVNLSASRFNNVNLAGARITDANLSGVVIDGATLANAEIRNADLTGLRIDGILVTDMLRAYRLSQD